MLIDWFTVAAQIVNFLILVWLLKRFLYKPILNAIDAREKRIVDQLADAGAKASEAQKQLDNLQHKNEVFEAERQALVRHATEEAKAERQKLLDDARRETDLLRAKRREMLRNEQSRLEKDIMRRTQQEVLAIAQHALSDLAGSTLEERMSEVFICRLRLLSGKERDLLTADIKSASHPVIVRSAFVLAAPQQASIASAIGNVFGSEIQIQFETSSSLVSGIELSANGHKVAWSIADYLKSLDKSISQLLEDQSGAEQGSDQDAA